MAAAISVILGVLAFVGYVFLLFFDAQLLWPLIGSAVASVLALILGIASRDKKAGKAGIVLGVIGILISIFIATWLTTGHV